MRRAGHVACMGQMRNESIILVGKPESLADLTVKWRIMLK
jgi:hypothetical protein